MGLALDGASYPKPTVLARDVKLLTVPDGWHLVRRPAGQTEFALDAPSEGLCAVYSLTPQWRIVFLFGITGAVWFARQPGTPEWTAWVKVV